MENRHVVIIPIEIDEERVSSYLDAWQGAAEVMAAQPGFIRTYMFRTIVPGSRFRLVNVAEWESTSHWEEAMNVCPMMGQQIAVAHASNYEAIRTVLPVTKQSLSPGDGHTPADLSPAEAHRRVVDGKLTLVDVREEDEWAARHPAGAVHAALSTLPASLSDLPDGPLAFVCRTGTRSVRGGARAIRAGRSSVHSVTGGLEAWEAAELPVILPDREDAADNGDRAKAAVREN
ncbi:rhodanese-like domain-containing protein [Streptomyces sp. NBC_01186]|uniref:rhodanese-like domain-containing protein n=1 Tax=unclassified Streptomyces TaxID=2593676 RepID=UPI002DD86091|nr:MULTISPECIES: rhodanese-like domain-containing protein [unclassified Streptomyces]WSB78234.1 rhodanese-like domain-containing protein [Streptomyces sp. NBC_01775]WSS13511.1 rhodanese-like domain-containing protein [Streptomyces sp. NBC_01186]